MARLLLITLIAIVLGSCDFFGEDEPALWIAFIKDSRLTSSTRSPADAVSQLILLNLDTGKTRPLTTPGASTSSFAATPDVRTLLWLEHELETDRYTICVADANGRNKKTMALNGGWSGAPRLSPDGSMIAYAVRQGGSTAYYVTSRNEAPPQRVHEEERQGSVIAVSPDNRFLLTSVPRLDEATDVTYAPSDLFILDIGNATTTRLTDDSRPEGFAIFSPDGTQVIYTGSREGDVRKSDIFAINIDGSNRMRLTDRSSQKLDLLFTPNEQQIAYVDFSAAGSRVHLMNRDGSNNIILAHAGSFDALSFSPDGSTLIAEASQPHLASNKDAMTPSSCASATASSLCFTGDIVKIDVHGGGLTRLTTDGEDDSEPVYSQDGRKIAFWRRQPPTYDGDVFVMNADGTGLRNVTLDSTAFASSPAFIAP